MAKSQQQLQNDDSFIAVHKQALADKKDVLEAIDTRMSKLGIDHDLLIAIATNVSNITGDVARLSNCLVGPNGDDGVLSDVTILKTQNAQLREDVDENNRRTNIWGGGNLVVILGAFLAAWFHK